MECPEFALTVQSVRHFEWFKSRHCCSYIPYH